MSSISPIDTVSDVNNNLNGKVNEQQLIYYLEKKKSKNVLEISLTSISPRCRTYLLYQYHYNEKDTALSNPFTENMLNPFLYDLQGRLASLCVFQAAWDGDQSVVKDFIEDYSTLKDQSSLYQTTLLYSAARNNHFDLVRYLIAGDPCSENASNQEHLAKDQEFN